MKNEILYLAAYDIRHPTRLRQALHVLLDYALGRQKSVFECPIVTGQVRQLLQRIEGVIDINEDRFALIRLDRRAATYTLGKAVPLENNDDLFYVG
jgi:CRISPR-associated protein Cas2